MSCDGCATAATDRLRSVISFSDARGSLEKVIDQVVDDADVAVISRRDAPISAKVFEHEMHGIVNPNAVLSLKRLIVAYMCSKAGASA